MLVDGNSPWLLQIAAANLVRYRAAPVRSSDGIATIVETAFDDHLEALGPRLRCILVYGVCSRQFCELTCQV